MLTNLLKGLPTLKQVTDGVKGFSTAYEAGWTYEYADAMQRGASPSKVLWRGAQLESLVNSGSNLSRFFEALKWTGLSWLITPFMLLIPVVLNFWPRAGANNETFNNIKDFLRALSDVSISTNNTFKRVMGVLLKYFARVLHWIILNAIRPIQNRHIIRAFDFFDKHLLKLSLMLTIFSYLGLFLIGQSVLAMTAGVTLLLVALDQKNWLPMTVRNFIREYGKHISFVALFFLGTYWEMLAGLILIPLLYGHHLRPLWIYLLGKFERTRSLANKLRELTRRVNTLDFRVSANRFDQSLIEMQDCPKIVVRAHVQDNEMLLPALLPKDNLDNLLILFDEMHLDQPEHRVIIEDNRRKDWRLQREEQNGIAPVTPNLTPLQRQAQDVAYLRANLATFIHRVRTGDIHSVSIGSEEVLIRYARAITAILVELNQKAKDTQLSENVRRQNKSTLLDALVRLSFETGEYCGLAFLRTTEATYRSLFGDNQQRTLKHCVRFIHQMNREQFFHRQYLARQLNIQFRVADQVDDTHPVARAIAFYAPRLGLPAQFGDRDEAMNFSPMLKDIFSILSPVEEEFWKKEGTVRSLKKQIRDSMNTPLLPIGMIDKWYGEFIDSHVEGTTEEKEDLKADLPYRVDWHGEVPVYELKERILNLMLLDLGVIALDARPPIAENYFRPNENIPAPVRVVPACDNPALIPAANLAAKRGRIPGTAAAQTPLLPVSAVAAPRSA